MSSTFLSQIFNLEKKIVVITGACGQLGSSICLFFKKAGATVIGLDVNLDNNENHANKYYTLDITKSKDVKRVFEKIFSEYGRLDILVNNAGVSTFEPFEQRPEDKFNWVVDVNMKGTFNCIQKYIEFYDHKKQDKGCIINMASMYGVISPDFRIYTDCDRKNSEVYGATKAGLIQLTRYFAVHLAERNIRVNAVSPGGVFNPESPQGQDFVENYSYRCPMKRMADAKEIAGAVLYLAGDIASYITGQNIIVDGGMTCW